MRAVAVCGEKGVPRLTVRLNPRWVVTALGWVAI
jgi:hypothetical protein